MVPNAWLTRKWKVPEIFAAPSVIAASPICYAYVFPSSSLCFLRENSFVDLLNLKFNFLQVYALMSFLSLFLPQGSIYFNSIREM